MYGNLGARSALNAFSALREWNLALIGSTTPESMAKTVNHPERGDMTFRVIVETMAGHDLNHLAQLDGSSPASPPLTPTSNAEIAEPAGRFRFRELRRARLT